MALFYGKFDANAYYDANPQVKAQGMNAEQHWALHGIAEGCPGYIVGVPLGGQFDPSGYLNSNPDVRNASMDPKEHYKECGWMENRDICIWVDVASEPSGTWQHLAKEGESFSVTGTKTVRYGVATQWVTKEVSGFGQCTKEFFGLDPAFAIAKSCQVLASGPKPGVTWSRIGAEGETVRLNGTWIVRYGAGTQWLMKFLSGSVECTNDFFGGDPAPDLPKVLEVLETDEVKGSWQLIAVEGQRFSIIGAQTIRYGEGEQWITKVLAGVGECTSAFFGRDPAPDREKSCEVWMPALKASPIGVLDFDGVDDFVEAFEVNVPLDDYTIEAWVKPDKMSGGIVSWGDHDGINGETVLRLSYNGIAHCSRGNDLAAKNKKLVGRWHHVAATLDGRVRCIYLNGELVAQDRLPARRKKAGKTPHAMAERVSEATYTEVERPGARKDRDRTDFRMGHYRPLRNRQVPGSINLRIGSVNSRKYFDGNLAEIRIWDRARSENEIRDDMIHRLVGDEPGLIGYWRLNNSGEANAQIVGAKWEFYDNLEHVLDPSYYYRLTSMWQGDGKSLHILNDGRNNLPILAGTADYASQYWKLTPLGNNYFRLTNRWLGPGKSLDIVDDGVTNNKPVMADTGNYRGQLWKLVLYQNGYYRISTQWQGEGKLLDIIKDGQNNQLILIDRGDVGGQLWKLTRTDVIAGEKDGIGSEFAPEYNGEVCNAQSAGCTSQGCASQGTPNCAAQACLAQAQGCSTQGCAAQLQGCAAQGCIAQAEGCAAQGCAAQVQGCAGQGCIAQAQGCAAQGCAAQAQGCAGQGCAAQAQGCAAQGCAAQAQGCVAQACAGQVQGCAAEGCLAQMEGCAAAGCAGQAGGCVTHGCLAQAGSCAAAGCAGDAGCAVAGCSLDACAAQGCAGAACVVDVGVPCAADGQLGPCLVDLPYCPCTF